MEFAIDHNSVNFEYTYKNFTVNIADFRMGDGTPESKISVLIQKHGEDISSKSVERVAAYIQDRLRTGIATSCNNVLEINIDRNDQFIMLLHAALDILFP